MSYRLLLGDCLDLLPTLETASVDMVCADPPYGTTSCLWDSIIPLEPMWQELKRVIKPRGAIVMTASQPFTTTLISSNREWFKYCWYWEKPKGGNFSLTGHQPLKVVEEVVVFSDGACTFTANGNGMTYNPQKVPLDKPYYRNFRNNPQRPSKAIVVRGKGQDEATYTHSCPRNILYGSTDGDGREHPTQKPVALMEYLIRTYTHEGDVVLDFCMGSGTTGVACVRADRAFIGIEKDEAYFKIAERRLAAARAEAIDLFAPTMTAVPAQETNSLF